MLSAVSPVAPQALEDIVATASDWQYELVVARPLPTIDLSVSVLSVFAGRAVDAQFFALMRRHYRKFVVLFRTGTVLMAVAFLTPASVGRVLTVLTACLVVWSLHFSVFMMSWQLLRHTLRMQEVLFMSTMNWLNWIAMATVIRDARIVICALLGDSIQLSILSDVMFRTVLSASKSALLALPLLLTCVLAVFLRGVHVSESNYASIHVNNIQIELVDVVVNVSVTLMLLVARSIYRQRRAFTRTGTRSKMISCTLLKSKLMLRQVRPTPATVVSVNSRTTLPTRNVDVADGLHGPVATPPSATQIDLLTTAVSHPHTPEVGPVPLLHGPRDPPATEAIGLRATERCAPPTNKIPSTTAPHLQQLQLVPTGLQTIDSRRTLVPSLTPIHHQWSILARIVHQIIGLTGLVLMVIYSMSLDKPRLISRDVQQILGMLSFSFSITFVGASVMTMQTTLLRLLLRHFDVVMNLFQFFTSALCLCAMVRWDRRCLVAATLCVWFFWIVSFDAVTPRVRSHMGLTKRHAGIALVTVMASLMRVVVVLTFDAHNGYVDSEIMESWIRSDVRIQVRTKSFFLNRMFPLTVWAVRLLWELLCCREAELVFLKGSLEYYCALDMLPTPQQVRPTPV